MVAFLACMEVIGSGYQVSHCKEFIFSFLIKKKNCCIFLVTSFYKFSTLMTFSFHLFYISSLQI